MLAAVVLGLIGSMGHCVGMCSGVAVLLSRQGVTSGWRLLLVHMGRITTYGLMGLVAGSLGQVVGLALPRLPQLQGGVALIAAGIMIYFALALLGQVPSIEIYVVGLTSRWGKVMRYLTATQHIEKTHNVLRPYLLGLMWGLLPCGLVFTALLVAVTTGSPWHGTLVMLAFGFGTWPALLGVGLLAQRGIRQSGNFWLRHVAATVVLLFAAQIALRGLAAWGWVDHLRLGGIIVW